MNPARRANAVTATAAVLATAGGLLTVTAAPASAAVTCTSPTYKRQFYANTTFSGTPKKTDCDSTVNENWGTGAPAAGLPSNYFGVRWTVTRDFGSGGPFSFPVESRDGIRVYLDGIRKVDLWKNVSTTQKKTVNVTIPSGRHTLRIDFVNWTGAANVKFGYVPRTSPDVDKVKPLTPAGASVSYDSATGKAKLTWSRNKEMDLAAYRVYRRLAGTPYGSTPLATTTATSYTDTPPPTGQTYYYEIRAVDKAGNVSTGTADQGVTTPDRTGPAAPTGLTAHGDLQGMVLGWNTVPDAAGYELYEKDRTSGAYTLVKSLTGTSYTHPVGHDETPHTYVVRALDTAGNPGPYSAPVTSDGIDRTAPAPPVNLRAEPSRYGVLLTWNTPEHPAYEELAMDAYFTVLRSKGTQLGADAVQFRCSESQTLDTSRGEYSYVCNDDESWELDTTYTYGVVLTDWQGNESAPSNTVTVTTADRVAPQPVSGLTATPRADGTVLRWNASAEDDIDFYRALRGVRQADGSVKWQGVCDPGQDDPLAALCIDVPDGESYVYAVYAVDKWGNVTAAADWATVTATELDTTPAEPIRQDKGPLYSGGGWSASEAAWPVQWTCSGDLCASVTEYRVSRWNPETRTYDLLGTVAPTSNYWQTYNDPAQPLGSISYYRVVGVLADGTYTAAAHPWCIRPDLV